MKIAKVKAFGSIDHLEIIDVPKPHPQNGEVLIQIGACGLNYSDLLQLEGLYTGGPTPPFYPGIEAAGIVEEVGEGVSDLSTGSRVAVINSGNMFAEYATVKADNCLLLPDNLSLETAAAFLVHYLTAYHSLITVAHATEGEVLLIHAAGGGVGTAVIQIAKMLGLKIIGTASTEEKRQKIHQLGVDIAVDYDGYEKVTRHFSQGKGADIIIDSVGGELLRKNIGLLNNLGRLVIIGFASKQSMAIDPVKLLFHSKGVLGFHLNSVLNNQKLLHESRACLMNWLIEKKIKPQVGHTFKLKDIGKAYKLIASRMSFGKIVLYPGGLAKKLTL
jgi:NADPH2:quinone reductase